MLKESSSIDSALSVTTVLLIFVSVSVWYFQNDSFTFVMRMVNIDGEAYMYIAYFSCYFFMNTI